MSRPAERQDPDAPNESAPGHEIPEPREADPAERPDPDAPNESGPGHNPDPGSGSET